MKNLISALVLATSFAAFAQAPAADKAPATTDAAAKSSTSTKKSTTTKPAADKPADAAPAK
jgi:Ni/Co efflux regulator RcnB